MLGRTIGRFRVVGKLGEGGMGSVWKAEDTLLGRIVALKFLPESLAASESARQRFLREARSTSGLDHPHIATLFEIGEEDGRQFLAVAFVDGETVSDRVARGPLAPREALRVAAEVAEALGHAHGRGVVHRDVTSRNIMIAKDGRAVVIDFGLALRDHTARITTTGATFGTIPYMAPEVVRGGAADARSDLYGLGVVLYELLTGRLPFAEERGVAALYASANRKPEPPSAHAAGIASEVDRITLRLLARDPARRPADAAAVAATLREQLAQADPNSGLRAERAASVPPGVEQGAGRGAHARSPLPAKKWLAIFPFRGVRGEGSRESVAGGTFAISAPALEDDLLASGLAEAVSTALAGAPRLRIIPPAFARLTPDAEQDLSAAARHLGANLVLHGTVRHEGDLVRVRFQLLEPQRGVQLAAETIDGSTVDLFAVEDALVAAVIRALRIEFAPGAHRSARRGGPATHETYLKALGYLQRSDQEVMIEAGIRLLEELIRTEGDTALVHAALGRAYLARYLRTFDPRWSKRAEASCRIALELDPHAADVLATLGRLHHSAGSYDEAVSVLRQALALNPLDVEAFIALSRSLEAHGSFGEAEDAARQAIALREDYWSGYQRLGALFFHQGQYDRALVAWRKSVELTPDSAAVLGNLGAAYFQLGRLDEALEAFERSMRIDATATACFGAGTVHFFEGRREDAVRMFERATRLSPRDPRAWGNLADAQRWTPGMEVESSVAFDRAIVLVREQLHGNPHHAEAWARLALWQAKRAKAAESIVSLDRALALAPANPTVLGLAVTVHHLAGDPDRAIEFMERALRAGYGWLELSRDPELAALNADPRTRRIVVAAETARLTALAGNSIEGGGDSCQTRK